MPALRSTFVLDSPRRLVAGALRDAVTAADALHRIGCAFDAPTRLLVAGDEIRAGLRGPAGRVLGCRTRITAAGQAGLFSELVAGPPAGLRHATTLAPAAHGTTVVDELAWTAPLGAAGRLADPLLRSAARRLLVAREDALRARVATLRHAGGVVGAALVRDGRLLAARRSHPPELAGRWEVPGGGVEPGESDPEAVRRECAEELGAEVLVGERVGTDLAITPAGSRVLRVYRATLAPGSPEPVAHEHGALRWVGPGELAGLGWLDNDRALIADLRALLHP